MLQGLLQGTLTPPQPDPVPLSTWFVPSAVSSPIHYSVTQSLPATYLHPVLFNLPLGFIQTVFSSAFLADPLLPTIHLSNNKTMQAVGSVVSIKHRRGAFFHSCPVAHHLYSCLLYLAPTRTSVIKHKDNIGRTFKEMEVKNTASHLPEKRSLLQV